LKLIILSIFGLIFLILVVNLASAGVVGGLNTVNENRSYTYDTVAPVINLETTNQTTFTTATQLLSYNVSDATTSTSNCSLNINGVLNQTNTSITENTSQNFTATESDGTYNWGISCSDAAGLSSTTSNRTFTVAVPTQDVIGSGGAATAGSWVSGCEEGFKLENGFCVVDESISTLSQTTTVFGGFWNRLLTYVSKAGDFLGISPDVSLSVVKDKIVSGSKSLSIATPVVSSNLIFSKPVVAVSGGVISIIGILYFFGISFYSVIIIGIIIWIVSRFIL